jgi:quinol monooxygenase YgiN
MRVGDALCNVNCRDFSSDACNILPDYVSNVGTHFSREIAIQARLCPKRGLASHDFIWPDPNTQYWLHQGEFWMNKYGILVTLNARPGKEEEVETFLKSATPLVAAEIGTTAWFAFRVGPALFGIFDTFKDEEGRVAHVNGRVAKALFARAEGLFETPPQIQTVDILAEKSIAMG